MGLAKLQLKLIDKLKLKFKRNAPPCCTRLCTCIWHCRLSFDWTKLSNKDEQNETSQLRTPSQAV